MGDAMLIGLVILAAAAITPLLTLYRPATFGPVGVVTLTAAGFYFLFAGQTAFTETTAAVLLVGAFCLAGIVAVARAVENGPTRR